MTDQDLDALIQRILLDSLKLDQNLYAEKNIVSFNPSLKYQQQILDMLKDPLKWSQKRRRLSWRKTAQKIAIILLIISVSFGGLIFSIPTTRAFVIQWFIEFYESYIVYRYAENDIPNEMPQYGISALPEGFMEVDRTEIPGFVSVIYQNVNGEVILLDYGFLFQGTADLIVTEDLYLHEVTINHINGHFFESKVSGEFNTVIWIDLNTNIQFEISSLFNREDILHIAESVFLLETAK